MNQLQVEETWDKLHTLLGFMSVPQARINDLNWLNRNLGIFNSDHIMFEHAQKLIKLLLKEVHTEIRKIK